MKIVYLFITVALELTVTKAEHDWSGFVNSIKQDFDYVCPDSFAVTGIASSFNTGQNDRQWEYQCSSGGGVANVSSDCTLQNPINGFREEFNFECPDDGYITGFVSSFSDSEDDRAWQPYCCTRPYSALVDCEIPSSQWENNVEQLLNWTTTSGRVLTGAQSFYASFNRDRRWRFKECVLQVSCGDPGTPENAYRTGNNFLYEDDVTFTCNHGYYQSSGPVGGVRRCLDTGLWSDEQPTCSLCTGIDNCADIRCTTPTDHYCEECDSDKGVGLGERGFENINTSCEPLCSWLQSFCYPGDCPGGYTSCNCTDGFAGLDCLEIIDEPDLNSCEVRITSPETLTTQCTINATQPTYINFIPTDLTATWDTSFVVTSYPPRPAYVHSYRIGISQADVHTNVYRMNSYPLSPASTTTNPCSTPAVSSDTPHELVDCTTVLTSDELDSHTFLHGDWFTVGISITNGGFLNITDLDSNTTATHHYSGTAITPTSLFVLDTHPPTHCSIVPSQTCLTNQAILAEMLVFNNRLRLSWGGWTDLPSQVTGYRIDVYKLDYNPVSGYLEEPIGREFNEEYDLEDVSAYSKETEPLSSEGPYSIILTITDTAGNEQYARRIIVYDDSSELKEDNDIPLVVSSGYHETAIDAFWHSSVTDPIIISGEGHFFNENLKTDNWLAPVEDHTPPVPAVFDDDDRLGVNNSLGITALFYQYIIDQEAGQSIEAQTQPASFQFETNDLALEAVQISPVVQDGDSVTVWFEARDFKNNNPAYENVLVHIDSSPPLVDNLGLVQSGVSELVYMYGSSDLLGVEVTFESSDIHSGMDSIQWSIDTDTEHVGSGTIPVIDYDKNTCLIDAECLCDIVDHCHKTTHSITFLSTDFDNGTSVAAHDTDYQLTVVVRNHAQLETSLTKQFTVDLTPPLVGVVTEKDPNRTITDIDYQTGLDVTIKWEGFFDRESSIIAYQYIIDTQCVDSSSFQYPNNGDSIAVTTNLTTITWTASLPATYYATVVAFNGAYLASDPVCSDGITIDVTPPIFTGISVPGARVQEGIARIGGAVWVVHGNRERSLVDSPSLECVNASYVMSMEEMMSYPIRCDGLNTTCIPSHDCLNYPSFNPLTYTAVDTLLNITWSVSDSTGIKDYWFGLATSIKNISKPDIAAFTSTAGFPHYSSHDSIFTTSNEFFVVVKTVDLAMQEVIATVGPVIIDITAPVVNGTVETDIYGDGLMIVSWEEWIIEDEEDMFPLTYEYSIGRTVYSDDVLPFTPLPSPHPMCTNQNCVAIDTTLLGFQEGNDYHISIKAENTAGLTSFMPVDPYTVPYKLDSNCMSVYEYPTDLDPSPPLTSFSGYFSQQYDHDVMLEESELSVGWYGLTDEHLNTSFWVGVGTLPGLADVAQFIDANGDNPVHLSDIQLQPGVTYYSTVKATNKHSTVTTSSDGFTIINSSISDAQIWNGLSDTHNEEYRLSSTEVGAHWYFPPTLSDLVSHYEWALYRANDHDIYDLGLILDYENTGPLTWGLRGPVELSDNDVYVSSVRACFKSFCLEPVYSDGFFIASPPDPSLSTITATYTPIDTINKYGHSSLGRVVISWDPFYDQVGVDYYEWAIGSADNGAELITDWSTLHDDVTRVDTVLTTPLSLHKQYHVTVRGTNIANLVTSISNTLSFTGNYTIDNLIVYDISSDTLSGQQLSLEFTYTEYTELDYTSSSTSLSAVWPDLRYTTYEYSVSTEQQFHECDIDNPVVLGCGSTTFNSITVSQLNLTHGHTYYVCIRAEAVNAFTPGPAHSQTVTSCTDGIIPYLTPPTTGCVQLRPSYQPTELPELTSEELNDYDDNIYFNNKATPQCINQHGSQSSTSELYIVWDHFTDQLDMPRPHNIPVANYEYAIGTSPGAENVVGFVEVGVVTSVRVTGLRLVGGVTYYATIRGTDHAGGQSLVTSLGMTVDETPPTFGDIWAGSPRTIAATSPSHVTPTWDQITDEEGGVSQLYWSLGSKEGLGDIQEWTKVGVRDLLGEVSSDLDLPDGQPIIVNLMAINTAGLVSISSSPVIVYDATPPCNGRVFDGPRQGDAPLDVDHTPEHDTLHAHWVSFWDPHSSLSQYQWTLGTCRGCSDVTPYTTVGLLNELHQSMALDQGETYYMTIKGCSVYSGCITSSSDGVTIDGTIPVTRQLTHGLTENPLIQFQASRSTITAHWSDIHDTESSLTHYTYYAGPTPGDDSYVTRTLLPPSQHQIHESSPFDNSMYLLPIGGTVYVTLEVFNGAGLSSTITSGGVVVSNLPPVVVETPAIDFDWSGSFVSDTQYVNSVVRVSWNFSDTTLIVDRYFWTMVFEDATYQSVSSQISYQGYHETLTRISLSDGSKVGVVIIGCNQAGLCAQAEGGQVLIDSSPPIDGYFAVKTNTSVTLPWAIENGMAIYNNQEGGAMLELSFTGFSDPHTGVTEYWAVVGSSHVTSDLYPANQPLYNLTSHSEGVIVTTINLTRSLTQSKLVYVSLWALNGVGLRSHVVQGTFRTVLRSNDTTGSLELLRSQLCPLESCKGHCTCSERGHTCDDTIGTCYQLNNTLLADDQKLNVTNFVPQLSSPLDDSEPLFTAVADKLVAVVEYAVQTPPIQFTDWSVGEEGKGAGQGLVDTASDPVWFPLVREERPVFTVLPSHPLVRGKTYVFQVRAWYNSSSYSIFKSKGVTFDNEGPLINGGYRVREVASLTSTMDIDFVSSLSELNVKWNSVFNSQYSTGYSTFSVCIGTSPGTGNTYPCTVVTTDTSISLTGLNLMDQTQYYTTIKAINTLGITTLSISDGFLVDISPPDSGIVFDGRRYHNALAHTTATSSYGRIFGFNDPQSSVSNFMIKFHNSYNTDSVYVDMQIARSFELNHIELPIGNTSFLTVEAINGAGLSTVAITSTGSVYDPTPPTITECTSTISVIETGSFDTSDDQCMCSISNWAIQGDYTMYHIDGSWIDSSVPPHHSCCAIELKERSSISQSFETVPDETHTLSVWVLTKHAVPTELLVQIYSAESVIMREKTMLRPVCEEYKYGIWQRLDYTFTSDSNTVTLSLTAPNHQSLIIDNVQVEYCHEEYALNGVNTFTIDYTGRPSSITWPVHDLESNIAGYQYAIGTVKGGEQILGYQSNGQSNSAFFDLWQVRHVTNIYFSVVATNDAGLSSVFYSNAVAIDETPPILSSEGIREVTEVGGADLDYTSEGYVLLDWSAITDEESGIDHCLWALGSSPGLTDIQNYTLSTTTHTNLTTLHSLLTHGDTLHVKVTCFNGAGHMITATSDGLTLLTNPPQHQTATVTVRNPSLTQCPSRDEYVSSNAVQVEWVGFTEQANAPFYYQMKIVPSGTQPDSIEWTSVDTLQQVTINDLTLVEDTQHTVMVRAYCVEGLISEAVSESFTIVSGPPAVDGDIKLNVTRAQGHLLVEWRDLFTSPIPVYYEVSLGNQLGGSAIRKLVTTPENFIEINELEITVSDVYFLSVKAIDYAGLSSQSNYMIDNDLTIKV